MSRTATWSGISTSVRRIARGVSLSESGPVATSTTCSTASMMVRERIRMTEAEIGEFLAAPLTASLATIGPDGTPHLVAMYYAPQEDGRLAFWTYRTSQKARNLARDPRCALLIETGDGYDQLRGVQVRGTVEVIEDPDQVRPIGAAVYGRYLDGGLPEGVGSFLDDQARKRNAYLVTREHVASWDHRKLAAASAAPSG